MDKLIEANDILLPQSMVEREIDALAKQMGMERKDDEPESDEIKELKAKIFTEQAERRVALGLLISKVASQQEIELDQQRIDAQLERIAASYQDSEEVISWYRQNPEQMDNVISLVLEEQVVDWLLEATQIVDEPKTFTEVMKPEQAQAAA